MSGSYAYTPAIWPPLAVALMAVALGLYSWRRRSVPGARPFAVACLFSTLWLAGIICEVAAVDIATKNRWVNFQTVWLLPSVTGMTCFVLEYAYPGRWLTRRNLILLSIAPILALLLLLTNEFHHALWLEFPPDAPVPLLRGTGSYILIAYGLGLILVNSAVLVWLFVRSPQHRWPVVLILFGQAAARFVYVQNIATGEAASWSEPLILVFVIPLSMYSIALFGFRIFDPLPAARVAAIEQMRDGMVVLDTGWQVLGLNAAAERILGAAPGSARGKTLPELLPVYPELRTYLAEPKSVPVEISLQIGPETRHHALDLSPLMDHRKLVTGYLLLLHDVTEQRRAQAQFLAQQWAEATLQEREQLAHELHDGLSQSLAFLNLQAQSAQIYLQTGQDAEVQASLARLIQVARELHGDVRELIGNLLAVSLPSEGFCAGLRQTVARFREQTGLPATLDIAGDETGLCEPAILSPAAGVQLLRIVQEALANVRRHAGRPSRIGIRVEATAGQLHLTVEDNGVGFDPDRPDAAGSHFGLQVMRQRAARLGGELSVHSAAGQGTRVEICLPLELLKTPSPRRAMVPAQPATPGPDTRNGTQHEDSPG